MRESISPKATYGSLASRHRSKNQTQITSGIATHQSSVPRVSPELFAHELESGNNMIAELGSNVLVCAFDHGNQKSLHTSRDTLSVTGRQLVKLGKRTSTMLRPTDSQPDTFNNTITSPQASNDLDTNFKAFLGRCGSPVELQEQNSLNFAENKLKKFSSTHNTKKFQFPLKLQIATH